MTLRAAEQDVAAGDVDHPVDHPHRGGLAAAGRADEHADLAGGDRRARARRRRARRRRGSAWSPRRTRARPLRGSRTAPRTGRCWLTSRGGPGEGAADATLPIEASPVRPAARRAAACAASSSVSSSGVERARAPSAVAISQSANQRVLGQQRAVQVGADDVCRGATPSKPERPSLPWPARTRPSGRSPAPRCVRPPWFSKPASTRRPAVERRPRSRRCRSAAGRPRARSRGRRGRRRGAARRRARRRGRAAGSRRRRAKIDLARVGGGVQRVALDGRRGPRRTAPGRGPGRRRCRRGRGRRGRAASPSPAPASSKPMPRHSQRRCEQQQVAAVGVDVHQVGIERADAQLGQPRKITTSEPTCSSRLGDVAQLLGREAVRGGLLGQLAGRRRRSSSITSSLASVVAVGRDDLADRARSSRGRPWSRIAIGWDDERPAVVLADVGQRAAASAPSSKGSSSVGDRGGEQAAGREVRGARGEEARRPRSPQQLDRLHRHERSAPKLAARASKSRASACTCGRPAGLAARSRSASSSSGSRSSAVTSWPARARSSATRPGAGADVEHVAAARCRRARATAAGRRRSRRTRRRATTTCVERRSGHRQYASAVWPRRGRAARAARAARCRWGRRRAGRRRRRAPRRGPLELVDDVDALAGRAPAYFIRSASSAARVPAQVMRRTRGREQLPVGVPDPGDVAAVGGAVVEHAEQVELAVLERERAQHLVGAGRVLDQQDRRGRGRRGRASRRGRRRARRPPGRRRRRRARRRARAPARRRRARCRRCRGRGGGARPRPPAGVQSVKRGARMPRSSTSVADDLRRRGAPGRSSGSGSGRGGRGRRRRRRRRGRSGGSAWSRRRAGARAARASRRRRRSRRRGSRGALVGGARAEVGDQRVVGVEHELRARGLGRDHRGPAVGDRLQLAVAVELVAEQVAEQHRPRLELVDDRGRARTRRPRTGRSRRPAPALARRVEQRGGDAAGHVRPGAVVDEPRAACARGSRRPSPRSSSCRWWPRSRRCRGQPRRRAGRSRAARCASAPCRAATCRRRGRRCGRGRPPWRRTAWPPSRITRRHHPQRAGQHPHGDRQVADRVAVGVERERAVGAERAPRARACSCTSGSVDVGALEHPGQEPERS